MVTDYLAKSFPEGNVPKAVIVPGAVKVSFKEWTLPTVGSRPHDPLATHDGYLWYSGQYANVLGRMDTKTGEIKEFRPPTPGSGPHGLVEDKDGNIWFTANSKGYIGKLDPEDRQVHRIQTAGPTHAIRTRRCSIRRACCGSPCRTRTRSGRLTPATGEIKMVTSPTPQSNFPTAWSIDIKGTALLLRVRRAQDRRDRSGHHGDQGMDRCRTPSRGRGASPSPDDDVIYYADYSRGFLGRLDPEDRRGEGMAVARRRRTRSPTESRSSTEPSGTANRP